MKKLLLFFIAIYHCFIASAQTTPNVDASVASLTSKKVDTLLGWKKGGTLNLAINEAGRNTYWIKGGEESAIGIKALVDYNFDKHAAKSVWYNSIRARYGVTSATSTGNTFLKNDDYLNFTSTLAKNINKKWSYAAFFSLESQFENFLTPGYIKFGPGIMYNPNDHFNLLFSPVMVNVTTKLANKNIKLYGVDAGKQMAFGLGAFAQAKMNYNLGKGVNYKSVATLYSNYLDHPGNIILDWSNLLTLSVNKYLGATVSLNMRYNDFEIGHIQVQHAIGVGLSYNL